MRYANEPNPATRRVHVPGRNDVGIVIQRGKNLGVPPNDVFCAVVHFPDTGEVAFYALDKLVDAVEVDTRQP